MLWGPPWQTTGSLWRVSWHHDGLQLRAYTAAIGEDCLGKNNFTDICCGTFRLCVSPLVALWPLPNLWLTLWRHCILWKPSQWPHPSQHQQPGSRFTLFLWLLLHCFLPASFSTSICCSYSLAPLFCFFSQCPLIAHWDFDWYRAVKPDKLHSVPTCCCSAD